MLTIYNLRKVYFFRYLFIQNTHFLQFSTTKHDNSIRFDWFNVFLPENTCLFDLQWLENYSSIIFDSELKEMDYLAPKNVKIHLFFESFSWFLDHTTSLFFLFLHRFPILFLLLISLSSRFISDFRWMPSEYCSSTQRHLWNLFVSHFQYYFFFPYILIPVLFLLD